MTKSKSDSLRTSKDKRVSPYGEYYISVKRIDMLRQEQEDCEAFYPHFYPQISLGYPMLIRAVFESDKEYFGKASKGGWVHNIPISNSTYTVERTVYHYDVSIYFPSLTTLNIIKRKCLIRLLLEDKEITDILAHTLDFDIKGLPGTPPISLFESFLRRHIVDIETKLKLQIGYPIAFEDIEGAQNMEIREQALRKFGYEDYVKEGFERKKIERIIFSDGEGYVFPPPLSYGGPLWSPLHSPREMRPIMDNGEKIIFFRSDIAFLQVKDSSINKAYFLKVPPDMRSVEEAKAWTFGLDYGEYNPVIET